MSSKGKGEPQGLTSQDYAVDLLRAFGGAIIFAFPLLMTMEMWQLGFSMGRWRLVLFLLMAARIHGGSQDVIDTAFTEIRKLLPFQQADWSGTLSTMLTRGDVTVAVIDFPEIVALKKKGAVTMKSREALTDADIERGWVLTCQSRACSSEELEVDYDAPY